MVHEERTGSRSAGHGDANLVRRGVGVAAGVALVAADADTVPSTRANQKYSDEPGPGGHEIFSASRSSAAANVLASCKRVSSDTAPGRSADQESFLIHLDHCDESLFAQRDVFAYPQILARLLHLDAPHDPLESAPGPAPAGSGSKSPTLGRERDFISDRLQGFDLREQYSCQFRDSYCQPVIHRFESSPAQQDLVDPHRNVIGDGCRRPHHRPCCAD